MGMAWVLGYLNHVPNGTEDPLGSTLACTWEVEDRQIRSVLQICPDVSKW
jgi:hypothetical protein